MTTGRLRIIVGATASGKERLALACAERMGGEIVSVDSMKVYRGLDIATAKAGPVERAKAPHHCLDLVETNQAFSAADFVKAAEKAVNDIVSRGKIPFLSGGSALYFRALLDGLFEGPGAAPGYRRELEDLAEREGSRYLHRLLSERDPPAAEKIHPSDLRRLVRALEVLHLTGAAISGRQTQWRAFHSSDRGEGASSFFANPRHPFVMVRIVRDRADIHRRIRDRVARMAELGLEAEARKVFENQAQISRTPLQAVGYKEFFPCFRGEETWERALEKLCCATNRLVRGQDTWFRKFPAHEVVMSADSDTERTAERLAATVFE